MIHIVNYGMGNLGSIQNMLKKINVQSSIISSPEDCKDATKLILPGVGHFEEGMRVLNEQGWIPVLNKRVIDDGIPILGICLGMQMMTNHSEEGNCDGLGWIEGAVTRFNFEGNSLKVPHMGWNSITPKYDSALFQTFESLEDQRFYHVHSYFVKLKTSEFEIATTTHGITFTSAFQKNNIYGVQFHPEKSHKFGMQLLKNFSGV